VNHIQIGTRNLGNMGEQPIDNEPRAVALLQAIQGARGLPVKIYEMVFSVEQREFTISTTSKDVFLQMGSVGEEGQRAFALLIFHRASMNGRALVTFPHADGCKGYLCVATRQTGSDQEERIHIDVSVASDK
jgi:sarcosine oxidase delta subunit